MRIGILGFVAGASWLQMQGALPDFPALLVGAFLLAACRLVPQRWLRAALACAAGFALGFGWAAYLAQCALAPQLAKADEGRDVTLIGVVDNLPYNFKDGVRFNFAVERVAGDTMRVPPHVALSWYAGQGRQSNVVGDVQPGERWQLTVRLQRPHGNANPMVCAGWFRKTASYRLVGSGHLWRLHSLAPHITHDMETDALESPKTEAWQSNRADKVDLHN